jgi:hypothetical protein
MIAVVHTGRLWTLMGLAGLGLAALTGACGGPADNAATGTTTSPGAEATTTSTAPGAAPMTTAAAASTTAQTPTTTAVAASTTATTTATTTGTKPAPWKPTSPAPTASQAAYELVGAWADHDRKAALADASPGAVAALFSNPYPAGGPHYRGCASPPPGTPASCVYRAGNDLLSLTASPFPNGWGVTAAVLES